MKKVFITITLLICISSLPLAAQQVQFEEFTQSAGLVMSSFSRWSTSMTWGDYDNDGFLDVYITSWGQASTGEGRNALFRNNGNGTFQNVSSSTGTGLTQNSRGAVFGDYDNDGDLDLFVANFGEGDVVFRNQLTESGSAVFSDVTLSIGFTNESIGNSTFAVWGDYNNDGYLDLYVTKTNGKNALYRNNAGSSFTLIIDVHSDIRDSQSASWTDYDDDGDVDLYVVNREQENNLFRNDDGTLVKADIGINDTQFGRYAAWADYDNNNTLDLFVANIGANSLYQQSSGSNRTFSEVGSLAGITTAPNAWDTWGAAWGDYDGDGDMDLFFVGGFDETTPSNDLSYLGTFGNMLLENNNGIFTDKTTDASLLRGSKIFGFADVGSFSSKASFADYDNDGDPDLLITNTLQNLFYKNNNPVNNYLKVRVQGGGAGANNRSGIGAKVRVRKDSSPLEVKMQEISSGNGPLMASFGLELSETYTIEVTFLKNGSGTPQIITIPNVMVPLDTLIIQQ